MRPVFFQHKRTTPRWTPPIVKAGASLQSLMVAVAAWTRQKLFTVTAADITWARKRSLAVTATTVIAWARLKLLTIAVATLRLLSLLQPPSNLPAGADASTAAITAVIVATVPSRWSRCQHRRRWTVRQGWSRNCHCTCLLEPKPAPSLPLGPKLEPPLLLLMQQGQSHAARRCCCCPSLAVVIAVAEEEEFVVVVVEPAVAVTFQLLAIAHWACQDHRGPAASVATWMAGGRIEESCRGFLDSGGAL